MFSSFQGGRVEEGLVPLASNGMSNDVCLCLCVALPQCEDADQNG